MQRTLRPAGRAFLALVLALILFAAPAAWAAHGPSPAPGGWLAQLWSLVTAWVAPADSGPTIDPSGLTTPNDDATPQPWDPTPLEPATADSANEEDDRGATIDPSG